LENQENEQRQARKIALMKKMVLRKGMSPEARERLGRVKLANPELALTAENVCVQLVQQGRRVDDDTLKEILKRLTPKKEIRIRRG
jgi:programmed cell death protein 5